MTADLVGLGVLVSGVVVAWWAARRGWRSLRGHPVVRFAAAVVVRGGAAPLPSAWEVAAWSPAKARRRIWRAVALAEGAVAVAGESGAPLAELPAVCRRLRPAAGDLDRVLRVGSAPGSVRELLAAAETVRVAAVDAAGEAGAARLGDLSRDARFEAQCVAAGLTAGRRAT